MKKTFLFIISVITVASLYAEDGYRLWLRYDKIDNNVLLQQYRNHINSIVINGYSPSITVAKNELLTGLQGLLGKNIIEAKEIRNNTIVLQRKPSRNVETPGANYDSGCGQMEKCERL